MTKYILHGGYTSVPVESNRNFFREIVKGLKENAQILIVYFARKEIDYQESFRKDKANLLKHASDKQLKLTIALKDKLIAQIRDSDVIWIRGGDTFKLLKTLRQYPDFQEVIKGKVVVGSSAGACVMTKYFFSSDVNAVFEGLGILPIALKCHYKGEEEGLKRLRERAKGLEMVLLKEYEYRVFEVDD